MVHPTKRQYSALLEHNTEASLQEDVPQLRICVYLPYWPLVLQFGLE